MLWISDALREMGWHVTFTTVGYSWISLLAGDKRLAALDRRPWPGTKDLGHELTSIFGYSPVSSGEVSQRNPQRIVQTAPEIPAGILGPKTARATVARKIWC